MQNVGSWVKQWQDWNGCFHGHKRMQLPLCTQGTRCACRVQAKYTGVREAWHRAGGNCKWKPWNVKCWHDCLQGGGQLDDVPPYCSNAEMQPASKGRLPPKITAWRGCSTLRLRTFQVTFQVSLALHHRPSLSNSVPYPAPHSLHKQLCVLLCPSLSSL